MSGILTMIASEETVIAIPVKLHKISTIHTKKSNSKQTSGSVQSITQLVIVSNIFKCNVVILKKKETQDG